MPHSKIGNLYIIQEREFIYKNESIYKMGRTGNLAKRICNYPKESIVHFAIHSKNLIYDENEIYNIFCIKFKARRDIGKEYFEGNIKEMIYTMTKYILEDAILPKTKEDQKEEENIKLEEKIIKLEEENIKLEEKIIKKDVTIVIMEFFDTYRIQFSKKIIKSKDIYQKLIDWIEIKKYDIFISHTEMTKDLINIYKITAKTHYFKDGVEQVLVFPNLTETENIIENKHIEYNNIKKPYTCICCGYKTSHKPSMYNHFYKKTKHCPKLINDIELTDEIKEYILHNRIYKTQII
jgi:hypothetical protein